MSIENGWFNENETMWEGMSVFGLRRRSAFRFESEGSVISREIKISGREMDGIGGVGHLGV